MLNHDIRFVEDDWKAPTGAAGLGWEVGAMVWRLSVHIFSANDE